MGYECGDPLRPPTSTWRKVRLMQKPESHRPSVVATAVDVGVHIWQFGVSNYVGRLDGQHGGQPDGVTDGASQGAEISSNIQTRLSLSFSALDGGRGYKGGGDMNDSTGAHA
jgi:hypothetical protein